MPTPTASVPGRVLLTRQLLRLRAHHWRMLPATPPTTAPMPAASQQAAPAAPSAQIRSWLQGLQRALGVLFIVGFVLLTWVRAESLSRMMPHLVDLSLGVLVGLIGNSLGYWLGLLGVKPAPACTASQVLKLAQIVGVPVAYVLLGGHMLLMPVTRAVLAATLVVVTRRLGWSTCGRQQ